MTEREMLVQISEAILARIATIDEQTERNCQFGDQRIIDTVINDLQKNGLISNSLKEVSGRGSFALIKSTQTALSNEPISKAKI